MSEQPNPPRTGKKLRPAQEPAEALVQHAPWKPIEAKPEEIGALQALHRGDAAAHQQHMALDFILKISYNAGAHYFPSEDGRRDTDYALGRAFVGQQIARFIKLKVTRGGEHG